MPPEAILDPATLDPSRPVADRAAVYTALPHRHEFQLLTAVTLIDRANQLFAGYLDLGPDAFWVRGHFPGQPLFPGVLQCESAAQLCGYYTKVVYPELEFLGLGGLADVRCRAPVTVGDRFIIVGRVAKYHRRQISFHTQGFVRNQMVFHAEVIGVPMRVVAGG